MSIAHFFDSPNPKYQSFQLGQIIRLYKGFEIWIVTFKFSQPPNMISVISQPLTPWWDIWKYTVQVQHFNSPNLTELNWKSIPTW